MSAKIDGLDFSLLIFATPDKTEVLINCEIAQKKRIKGGRWKGMRSVWIQKSGTLAP